MKLNEKKKYKIFAHLEFGNRKCKTFRNKNFPAYCGSYLFLKGMLIFILKMGERSDFAFKCVQM